MTIEDESRPIPKPRLRPDGNVDMPEWTRRGKMLVRRDALDLDDPEHPVNELLALGLDPAEFGMAAELAVRNRIVEIKSRLYPTTTETSDGR